MDTKTITSVKITKDHNLRYRSIPKTISYFFLISQLVVGSDFGFSKLFYENVQRMFRIFCTLVVCMYCILFFLPIVTNYPTMSITHTITLIPFLECILNVIVLLCYKKYTIYDFLCNISQFCKLTKNDTYILSLLSIIHCITILCLKLILLFMMNAYEVKVEPYFDQLPPVYFFMLCLYYVNVDLVAIAQIVIFYYVCSSMKNLKVTLTSSGRTLNFISTRYKTIVDTCVKIRPLSDSLVSNSNLIVLITHNHTHC